MSSHSTEGPVKWMRKGTRACQECRRRKIKCIYPNDGILICQDCSNNSRVCTRQGVPAVSQASAQGGVNKSSRRLKVRVTRLESVVERISRSLPQQLTASPSNSEPKDISGVETKEIIDYIEREVESISPLYALFKNEVLSTTSPLSLPLPLNHTLTFPPSQATPAEKLLSTISSETSIFSVLNLSSTWWPPFQNHYSFLTTPNLNYPLQDFVTKNLASENPVSIAIALICIVTSMQTLRPGIDDQNLYLSASIPEVLNKITAAVDQTVLNDDKEISSFEGVVLLLMRAKHHAESNQLRKAWLGIRRAVLVTQKIGTPGDDIHGSWETLVNGILEIDRFFSMFLGMPYATNARFDSHPPLEGDIVIRMRGLRKVAAIAAGRINDRNAGAEELAFEKTRDIQRFLDTAVAAMPSEWWDLKTHTSQMLLPWATFEHLNAQFWFFQTQCFLQLPYTLQATSNAEFLPNRSICLNASRSLVRIWLLLRRNTAMDIYLCRLDDFQSLVGAIIILVGLLQYLDEAEDGLQEDLVLLEEVKMVFRDKQKEQNGAIARQGLHVLDTLGSFLESKEEEQGQVKKKVTLFVPYFGAITVEASLLIRSKGRFESSENGKGNVCLQEDLNSTSQSSWDVSGLVGDRDVEEHKLSDEVIPTVPVFQGYPQDGGSDMYDCDGSDGPFHESLFDWEGIMLGTELNQDWNEQLVDFG